MRRLITRRIANLHFKYIATARAQQSNEIKRIGVLMPYAQDDPETSLRFTALRGGLLKLGGWQVVTSGSSSVGLGPMLRSPDKSEPVKGA
jgi:hypothetical protein